MACRAATPNPRRSGKAVAKILSPGQAGGVDPDVVASGIGRQPGRPGPPARWADPAWLRELTPDDALRHLANMRHLLKELDARSACSEVVHLYPEQLDFATFAHEFEAVHIEGKRSEQSCVENRDVVLGGPAAYVPPSESGAAIS